MAQVGHGWPSFRDDVMTQANLFDEEPKEKRKRFTPPTADEVAEYCSERNNGVDPDAFCDFYAAKGWMIGKSKMVDWKAAVRTWERRNGNFSGGNRQGSSNGLARWISENSSSVAK